MVNIREKIIFVTSQFLKGNYDVKSYERDLKSILEKCDQKTESLVCRSFLNIAQSSGFSFTLSESKYKYLCRCICFLKKKEDFELKPVTLYRFTWWNILAIAISAVNMCLFLLGGYYRYLIFPLSLILINLDVLNPMYEPRPPPKYKFHPFKSENVWLLHLHVLTELKIDEVFSLKKFRIKPSIGNICFYIYSVFVFPFLVLHCIFPQRCTYLMSYEKKLSGRN